MSDFEVLIQQLLTGLSNGMIIALIALGYTMVYGIVELINFAHGDLFMLGSFLALTVVGILGGSVAGAGPGDTVVIMVLLFTVVPLFCGALNFTIDRVAYRPLRNAPRVAPLVAALGVSFILMNLGLFWGGLPMEVFNMGNAAAAPKSFPELMSSKNLLGTSNIYLTQKDLLVFGVTVPLMGLLSWFVRHTLSGKCMRAVAQDPIAAKLMGINVDKTIGITFFLGGALGGIASVIYAIYNNTIYFQMGFRVGIDAFSAAVLGGIGSMPGAVLGGVVIGLIRALSDQYIATQWTNVLVFSILICTLVFRPAGLLGLPEREKV